MKRVFQALMWGVLVTVFLCAQVDGVYAAFELSSSPNPVGSGARAMGMGGAFIGVADDATAASWNPAGLIQLETPEVSVVYASLSRSEDAENPANPAQKLDSDQSMSSLNYLSAVYPFQARGMNMVASVNYQHMYAFTKKGKYDNKMTLSFPPWVLTQKIDFSQEGDLYALSPALAIELTPGLSVGMTVNFWGETGAGNEWTERLVITPTLGAPETREDRNTFTGRNYHFGFLMSVSENLTVGGVYKTKFSADVKRTTISSSSGTSTDSYSLHMPESYGLGVQMRFSDALTAAFDIYKTEWHDFYSVDSQKKVMSPVTRLPINDKEVDITTQVRVGVEYLMIKPSTVIPLRAGAFVDPEPGPNHADMYYGLSLGSGIMWKNLVLDVAYIFRWGNHVDGIAIGLPEGSRADVRQHRLLASAIYHF